MTGHSTREMFDRYNAIDESDTRRAVAQMVNFIGSVDHSVDQGTLKKTYGQFEKLRKGLILYKVPKAGIEKVVRISDS